MQSDTAGAAPLPAPRVQATTSTSAVALAAILAVAFALRLAWMLFSDWHPLPDDDAYRYDFAARALLDGHGYVHLNGTPTAFWPPGYPLLLAATYGVFGEHLWAAQLLNVALGTATVALVYVIGRRLFDAQTALIGAAIVAAFPSLIMYSAVTLSEVAFTFLVLLAVYFLVREAQDRSGQSHRLGWRLLVPAGLVLGFAALVRGQALLLPLVLVPYWLLSGMDWGRIGERLAVLAVGMIVIVTPWTVRNAIELHGFVPISTNAGVDFWIGHNKDAGGGLELAAGQQLILSHPELSTEEREVRISREGFQKGLKYALTHPAREVVLSGRKVFWLYYNDEAGLKWNEGHGSQRFLSDGTRQALTAISNVYYFAVAGLVIAGIPFWLRRRDAGLVLLISLVAYWTLVHIAFFGDPRFHAPIMPAVALLAALTLVTYRASLRSRARPSH